MRTSGPVRHVPDAKPPRLALLKSPALTCTQPRSNLVRAAGKVKRGIVKLQRWVRANERLLIVAASSCIMSVSHTALRPVLPVFAKVWLLTATPYRMPRPLCTWSSDCC